MTRTAMPSRASRAAPASCTTDAGGRLPRRQRVRRHQRVLHRQGRRRRHPALTTTGQHNIRQKHQEVEFAVNQSGTNTATTPTAGRRRAPRQPRGGRLDPAQRAVQPGEHQLDHVPRGGRRRRSHRGLAARGGRDPPGLDHRVRSCRRANLASTGGTTTWTSQTFPISQSQRDARAVPRVPRRSPAARPAATCSTSTGSSSTARGSARSLSLSQTGEGRRVAAPLAVVLTARRGTARRRSAPSSCARSSRARSRAPLPAAVRVRRGARAAAAGKGHRVLVFTKTTGFRHASIPDGVKAIRRLGRRDGFSVDATATRRLHRAPTRPLRRRDLPLDDRHAALARGRATRVRGLHPPRRRLRGRPRGVGHARADGPWYERLVGARFKRHDPGRRPRDRHGRGPHHGGDPRPARGLAATDEWYEFRTEPARRRAARILGGLDRPSAGLVPPLRWRPLGVHGDGTYKASFTEPRYLAHLLGAIAMAAGRARFGCAP